MSKKILREALAWNVYLNGKLIDTVWSTEQDPEGMKRSLINHDGYDSRITVDLAPSSKRPARKDTKESAQVRRLREVIRTMIRKRLREGSTTGGVAGFSTPFAFQGQSSANKKKHKDTAQQAGFEEMDDDRSAETSSMHNEGSDPYYAYRNDESRSPRQKVGHAIAEVNRRLTEIDRLMRQNARLKKEVGLSSSQYWKRTNEALVKIEGRIHRIAHTISELRN